MCHGAAIQAFPAPLTPSTFAEDVAGFAFGDHTAVTKIAILPDIYGCNPFYYGLATRYAQKQAEVLLINPFDGYGELPNNTRDEAFARRHKVRDKQFLDRFENFVSRRGITCVFGFCLGGLYIFELARRNLDVGLVGLYGFPQGMANQDPLETPLEYLPTVTTPFTMLMGQNDVPVGPENIAKLEAIASQCPAMSLTVYQDVGHNFLPLLDSDSPPQRAIAEDAIAQCDAVALG